MPRYPFRCETCGLTFEVSRSMSDAGSDAQCPADGARAVRVFTMPATNFNRPTGDFKPPASTTYSHYGHAHGAGAARHSHGPARGPRGGAP
jgi:putative FmdB family regulatory protein